MEEVCLQLLFERCDCLSRSGRGLQLIPQKRNIEGEGFGEQICQITKDEMQIMLGWQKHIYFSW